MTATESPPVLLYRDQLEFRSFVAAWVADSRCPIAFSDYLRELGLDAAAEAALWAATERDRPVEGDHKRLTGPYPWRGSGGWRWWWSSPIPAADTIPDCVGEVHIRFDDNPLCRHDDDVSALVALLQHWPVGYTAAQARAEMDKVWAKYFCVPDWVMR